MESNEERITSLETKIMHLEDFLSKIHAIVVEHSDFIDQTKAENRLMRAKLSEIAGVVQDMPNLRPPHY